MAARSRDVFCATARLIDLFGVILLVKLLFVACSFGYKPIDYEENIHVQDPTGYSSYSLFTSRKHFVFLVTRTRGKFLTCLLLLICGYIETCPGPSLLKNYGYFTILHQNIRGLVGKKEL